MIIKTKQTRYMTKHTQAVNNELSQLAADARALMVATSDVAGEKVADARKHLAAALDGAREAAGRIRERAAEQVRGVDQSVRGHPYQAIAIGVGVGGITGYFLGRRRNGNRH